LAAVAMGARIIEKHFTLDKRLSDFRDHALSADPRELSELTRRIRLLERSLGTFDKTIQECERAAVPSVRRGIAASRDLKAGHRLSRGDLVWLRPSGAFVPGQEHRLLGKRLRVAVRSLEPFDPKMFAAASPE
jgi:sialic acid synthase SpsE